MPAIKFVPSALTEGTSTATYLPTKAPVSATDFSFENTYIHHNGLISREKLVWFAGAAVPVRSALEGKEDDPVPFLWTDRNTKKVFLGALVEQDSDDEDEDEDMDNEVEAEVEVEAKPTLPAVNNGPKATNHPLPPTSTITQPSIRKDTLLSSAYKASLATAASLTLRPSTAMKPTIVAGPKPAPLASPFHTPITSRTTSRTSRTYHTYHTYRSNAPLSLPPIFALAAAPVIDPSRDRTAESWDEPSWTKRCARVRAASMRLQEKLDETDRWDGGFMFGFRGGSRAGGGVRGGGKRMGMGRDMGMSIATGTASGAVGLNAKEVETTGIVGVAGVSEQKVTEEFGSGQENENNANRNGNGIGKGKGKEKRGGKKSRGKGKKKVLGEKREDVDSEMGGVIR